MSWCSSSEGTEMTRIPPREWKSCCSLCCDCLPFIPSGRSGNSGISSLCSLKGHNLKQNSFLWFLRTWKDLNRYNSLQSSKHKKIVRNYFSRNKENTAKSREKVILEVYKRGCCHPFHKVRDSIITGFRGSRVIPALQKFCCCLFVEQASTLLHMAVL